MARNDDTPRRLPQWKADEIFARMTRGLEPAPEPPPLEPSPVVAAPAVEPAFRLCAARPEDVRDDEALMGRTLALFFGWLIATVLVAPVLGGVPAMLTSFLLLPLAFVKLVGRHARAHSLWNVGFWSFYTTVLFVLLMTT